MVVGSGGGVGPFFLLSSLIFWSLGWMGQVGKEEEEEEEERERGGN